MRGLPGLAAVRRGALNLDPVVRGLGESQVATVVDGARVFAAGPARMDSGVSHVSPHAVESLEIVKGPYALVWGGGALSAVRVKTHQPSFRTGGFQLGGRLGYGFVENGSQHDGNASLWGAGEELRFSLSAGVRAGDDYEAGDARIPAHYTSYDTRWSLGYQPDENLLLEYIGGWQDQRDLDYPGRLLDASYFKTHSHTLRGTRRFEGGVLRAFEAEAYVHRKDHRMNNDDKPTALPNPDRIPPFGIEVELPTESDSVGGRLGLEAERGRARIRVGGDLFVLSQDALRRISRRTNGALLFEDAVWPRARMRDLGLYAQALLDDGDLHLGLTVRTDLVAAEAESLSDFFQANTSGEARRTETNLSAAGSARLDLAAGWSLTAGVGRAVRSPSTLERYSDRFPSTRFQSAAEFVGDPSLVPETSLQADLGARLDGEELSLAVSLFGRVIQDYITATPDPELGKRLPLSPPLVYRYENGDRARSWGVEAELSHRLSDRLSWRGSASYVWGEDGESGEPLFGQPPLRVDLGARLTPAERLWLEAQLALVARQGRVAESRLERPTPGYQVLDVTAGFWATDGLELRLSGRNLTDETYADHLNSLNPFTGARVPERGRSLALTASYSF